MIPSDVVETFPHYGGKGCEAIGVTPEDVRQGIPNVIPEGIQFAARRPCRRTIESADVRTVHLRRDRAALWGAGAMALVDLARSRLAADARVAAPAPIVDRIKSGGVIRCGGVSRPGLVGQSPDGRVAAGLYLDLCRAIGAALLGPEGRIEFHPYDSDKAFERARNGADDLFFLDGSEIIDHRLARQADARPCGLFRLDGGDGPWAMRPSGA